MSEEIDPRIHDAVSRFFKSRREGVRLSVEAALGGRASAADAVSAARLIAQSAKSRGAPSTIGGAPGDDGASAPGHEEPIELPEIEGYDIIDIVGRGGMGAVYEAYQRSTGRRVAVKMMLETLGAGERTRRRFEREVELVARLQHPNIVSVLDSGVQRGRYFYVMEFIEGRTLDAAYPPGAASPRAVLEILARIALAVDYAHQRGVIHRDLKPGNILIDERGEPHLLDFGLAKSFDPNSLVGVRASLSEPGQFLGTLLYMPPEQARGETESMSVRSDVYSLGAIGYELITGRPPCGTDGPLGLVLERINSIDPARPSTIRAEVERDCDAILMKCLEKAPTRRYGSAGELAADIRRSLNNEPIVARRTGVPVRAWRWVKRNKLAATVAAAVITVSVGSLASWAYFERQQNLFRETQALIEVEQAKQNARGASEQPDPRLSIALLRHQSQQASNFVADKAQEAVVRYNLGWAFNRWAGECFTDAQRELTRALELYRATLGPQTEESAKSAFELGRSLYFLGRHVESAAHFREAHAIYSKLFGARDARTLDAAHFLAGPLTDLGQYAEAVKIEREVLAAQSLVPDAKPWRLAMPMAGLARLLMESGQYGEAESLLREALALAADDPNDRVLHPAKIKNNLAVCILRQGRAEEALAMFDSALSAKRTEYGMDNDDSANTLAFRAEALMRLGRRDEAMSACDQALTIQQGIRGAEHANVAPFMIQKARFLLDEGRADAAEPLAATALQLRRQKFATDHPHIAEAESLLAACMLHLGRANEAEPLLRHAVTTLISTRGVRHPVTQRAIHSLIDLLNRSNREGEASDLARLLQPEASS